MAETPSHVRIAGGLNRQYLSDLSMLVERSYPEFIKKYPAIAASCYIMGREANGDVHYTDNKRFFQWSPRGKNVPSFKASAAVNPGASTGTITAGAAYYLVAGTLSPLANGHVYRNDTNGQIYRLTNVNTTTANAHTATITETTGANIAIATTDLLVFYPTVVGEKSGTQEGIYRAQLKVENWCATIKQSKEFTDWALFERVDSPGNTGSYKIKDSEMQEQIELFMYQQEMLLMFQPAYTNIAGVVNQHNALIPQVIASGQTDTTSTLINANYFDNIRRLIDAEGYAPAYDALLNIELRMKLENFMASTYNNGAIVYKAMDSEAYPGQGMEINRNFKAYDIHGLQFNFKTYDFFSSPKMYGAAPNTGLWNNAGLFIPRGETIDPETKVNVPRFRVRYQAEKAGDPAVRMRLTGGMAPVPTSDVENLVVSHVATKGVQAFGLNGYFYTKLSA